MMLVCPLIQAEEDEPEPKQLARWFFSLFGFQRTKSPAGPGLEEVSILDLGEAKGTRDRRLSTA
jgi:hypothetical protein